MEDTTHYLLQCPNYAVERLSLFNGLKNLSVSLFPLSSDILCDVLLYGFSEFSPAENSLLLSGVIKYILATHRFDGSIFN